MSVLLETTLGDIVIDLDLTGSPKLCRNFLKLCQIRYYTNTLIYNVQANRFCQAGDPCGDGSGGASIYGVMDVLGTNTSNNTTNVKQSTKRFLPSHGRCLSTEECRQRGRVVMTEMNGIPDTIGSQFLITLAEGEGYGLDGYNPMGATDQHVPRFLSLGQVVEDDDAILDAIHAAYCDTKGRPYADIRIVRALVLHDPFTDPDGMDDLIQKQQQQRLRGAPEGAATDSPNYERPPEEVVERRIRADQIQSQYDHDETPQQRRQREEEQKQREAKSRAVVLEMLGDLPNADITAPDNVLFVCKLNPITQDDDLELIFSRFDSQCKAEIIRDPDSGRSLCYAFVEFQDKKQCVEAYFKMNNALVDDRRIKVDFSQSVAKVWSKFHQQGKAGGPKNMPRLDFADGNYNGSSNSRNQRRGDRGGVEHRNGRGFDHRPLQQDKGDRYNRRGSSPPSHHPERFHQERQDHPRHASRTDRHRDAHKNIIDNSNHEGVEPVRPVRAEPRDRMDSSDDDSRERKSHRTKDHKKRNKKEDRYDDDRRRDYDDRKRRGDDHNERSSRRHDDQDEEKRHRKKDRRAENSEDDDHRRRKKHRRHSDDEERHRKHSKKHRKRSRSGDRGNS